MKKAIYIEWEDSSAMAGRVWQEREQVSEQELCRCSTIGFVINETKDSITIAGSMESNDYVSGDMTIPKSAIRKRRIVSWKK